MIPGMSNIVEKHAIMLFNQKNVVNDEFDVTLFELSRVIGIIVYFDCHMLCSSC